MSEILFLSGLQIESVGLTAAECVGLIRRTLACTMEMPPKSGVHPPKGRHVHAMSAFIPSLCALGVKWIADFPRNPGIGLPTLSAVIILNDPETGVPLCIMDGVRTKLREESETAAIIGTGVQASAQARGLPAMLPGLRQIFVVGSELTKATRFCQETGSPKFLPAATRKQAVEGADIVVTVTNAVRDPLLEAAWLKPGVTVVVLWTMEVKKPTSCRSWIESL